MIDRESDFSEWLEGEMKQRGMTQADVARVGGITRSAVNKLLNRQQGEPGIDMLLAIARALDLPREIVFQRAGLLDPLPGMDTMMQEILYELGGVSMDDRDEILEFIRMKRRRNEKRETYHTGGEK